MKIEDRQKIKMKLNRIKLQEKEAGVKKGEQKGVIKQLIKPFKDEIDRIRKVSIRKVEQSEMQMQQLQVNLHSKGYTTSDRKKRSTTQYPIPQNRHSFKQNSTITSNKRSKQSTTDRSKFHKKCTQILNPLYGPYQPYKTKKIHEEYKKQPSVQVKVSEFDRLTYQKKYKQFLKKKDYVAPLPSKQPTLQIRYQQYEGDSSLLQTLQQFPYCQMRQRYNELFMKAQQKRKSILKFNHKYMYDFRQTQFNMLSTNQRLSKTKFREYLFDRWNVMMLFNVDPMTLDNQLTDYDTKDGDLDFLEFSGFLLLYRPIVNPDNYKEQNLEYARIQGPKLMAGPLRAQLIASQDVLAFFQRCFKEVDLFANGVAQRGILAIKLNMQMKRLGIQDQQVIKVINIGKILPVHRIVYEIEHQYGRQQWTHQEYWEYLNNYKRLNTPVKDRLIQELIMSGKMDPSYIMICNQLVPTLIKQVYGKMQKIAEHFVNTQKFIQRLLKHQKFSKICKEKVRKQKFKNLGVETVQQVIWRMMQQVDEYLDLDEILQFFNNRGRPRQYQVRAHKRDLQLIQQSPQKPVQQQQLFRQLKALKLNRFIENMKKFNIAIQKPDTSKKIQLHVTVPIPFKFDQNGAKKKTIRQIKLEDMLSKKQLEEISLYKPFKANPVPLSSSCNMFEAVKKQQEQKRKQRKQKFRQQSIKHPPPSQHLYKPVQKKVHSKWHLQNYKFTARPLPWFCQVQLLDKIQNQKLERKNKIYTQVLSKHQTYGGGQGIKNMEERLQGLKQKWKEEGIKRNQKRDSKGQKKQELRKIKSHSVPDFKSLHLQFQQQMQSRKKEFVPTQPRQIVLPSQLIQSKRSRKQFVYESAKSYSPKKRILYKQTDEKPPSTMKFDALVDLKRKQKKAKELKQKERMYQQDIRQMRKKKFAPYVRAALPKQRQRQFQNEQKLAKLYQDQHQKELQFQRQMQQMYTRVLQRPLLAQQYS